MPIDELVDPAIRLTNWLHGDERASDETIAQGEARRKAARESKTARAAAEREADEDAEARARSDSWDGAVDRMQKALVGSLVDAAPELSVKTWDSDGSDGEGDSLASRIKRTRDALRAGKYDPDEMLDPAQRLRRAARNGELDLLEKLIDDERRRRRARHLGEDAGAGGAGGGAGGAGGDGRRWSGDGRGG